MAAYSATYYTDLAKPSRVIPIMDTFTRGDNESHTITVMVYDSNNPTCGLMAGSVSGAVARQDGNTVPLTNGTKGSAVVSVDLPGGGTAEATPCTITLTQACFDCAGQLVVVIRLVNSETITSVFVGHGKVNMALTNSVIDPGTVITDITALIAAAEQAAEDAEEALEQASAMVSYAEQTGKTDAQKEQARTNIGAASDADVSDLKNSLSIIKIIGNQIPWKVKETLTNKYFYISNSAVTSASNANYDSYIIPITDPTATIYYKSTPWAFVTDDNGTILAGENSTRSESVDLSTLTDPAYLYYSNPKNEDGNVYVSYDSVVTQQINTLDGQKPCAFSELTGKLTADMVDGFAWGNLKGSMVFDTAGYRYANGANKSPYVGTNANMSTYLLDIGESVYTFSNPVGFLTPINANGKSVVASIENATTYDNTSGDATQLYISIQNSVYDGFIVSQGTVAKEENTYPDWLNDLKCSPVPVKYFDRYTGNYSAQIKLQSVKSSISSNVEYAFSGDISSWGSGSSIKFMLLDVNNTEQIGIEVNDTNLVTTSRNYGTPATNAYAHGLTISNNLQIHVINTKNNIFKISVTSNGTTFTKEVQMVKQGVTYPSITATSVTVTNISFSWTSRDIQKPIWCFGDSYFGAHTDIRWVYYLVQNGYYESHLFDNYPGENSANSYASLTALLKLAKPKILLWALGMNDGSDTTTPATAWKTNLDKVIALCGAYDIELVLATIPSVPTVNNEKKNEWVRSSNYQYIDFAKAVGAQSDGTWYTGMLSSDEVHPSATGANALYNRALADFPAITLK